MTAPGKIDRADLKGLIDDFLFRRLDPGRTSFRLRRFVPRPTWNRFDLGFKLLYVDSLQRGRSDFANRIYADHIAAFSLGDMVEPGNSSKSGGDRFRADFEAIFSAIERDGFDPNRSLLPLARDGSLLNGAHRAAAALACGSEVVGVDTGLDPMFFDSRFFETRGMPPSDIDAAAVRLVEDMPHSRLAILWPAATGKTRAAEALLSPVIHQGSVSLTLQGGHNLLARVYDGEPWLGPAEAGFPGIRSKLMACFSGTDPLRILIIAPDEDTDIVSLKDRVRELYGIAKSSIHITDTHAEAVEISRLFLNRNSVHFLNTARPMAFAETRDRVATLSRYLDDNDLPRNSVAADTGMVLGAYGLRPPGDIDVIADRPLPPGPVELHGDTGREAGVTDLLQDPARHFTYFNLKFVSLAEVAALKRFRLAGRDRDDLLLIEPLLASATGADQPNPLRVELQMRWLRLRRGVIRTLMRAGVGEPLRRLYRRMRGR